LPPSFAFDSDAAVEFLDLLRQMHDGPVVFEPRHPTWFSEPANALLDVYRISRVAADPPPVPDASVVRGGAGPAYFRLHGSPRMYWSRYDSGYIEALAETVRQLSAEREVWCVFDNTATGAAIENACELRARLRERS
jgi:uncharacterized protein YecE (DUF72 family)